MHQRIGREVFSEDDICINHSQVRWTAFHDHDFIEIAYIEKGEGQHCAGEREMPFSAGNYFIIDRNVKHRFEARENLQIYNYMFTPRFLDMGMIEIQDFSQMTEHYLFSDIVLRENTVYSGFRYRADRRLQELFRQMYWEYTNKAAGYLHMLQAQITEVIIMSLRQASDLNPRLPHMADGTYGQIIKYICYHYDEDLRLEDLARMAFVSPEHFSRQFKNYAGKTVTDFLRSVRVDEASRLLVSTDLRMDEVAERVGYHDTKYFAQVFRRIRGESPTSFRRNQQQKNAL